MSLTCDVTGSTDNVDYLPKYMQTDKIKKVCFRVAVKMEKERLAAQPAPKKQQETAPEKSEKVNKPAPVKEEKSIEEVAKKKPLKKK